MSLSETLGRLFGHVKLDLATANDKLIETGDATILILNEDEKHVDISDTLQKLSSNKRRKSGTKTLLSIESFIQYVNDQDEVSFGYIYVDPESMTITACFNDDKSEFSGWQDHKAIYKPATTPEYNDWITNNRKAMDQTQFGEFIEAHIVDIAEPAGTTLLNVALTLQAKTDVNFASHKRLDNGQAQLHYTENISATAGVNGDIQIPTTFKLGLRIFKNAAGYQIPARLKYRLGSGQVRFTYELDRPEAYVEDAFKDFMTKLQSETKYTVLMGKS